MNKKQLCEVEPRMLTQKQAETYTGMGRNSFSIWATKIGAKRHFGRSVRYDRRVIDKALDEMCAGDGGIVVGSETA